MRTYKEDLQLYKAKVLRDKYKGMLMGILQSKSNQKVPRTFPIYFENWIQRILKIEYKIIDLKYK